MNRKTALLFFILILLLGCRQFQQKQASGTVYSNNDQFRIDYSLSYSTGDSLGADTPERAENLMKEALNGYRGSFAQKIDRSVYMEVKYEEAIVRLIHFTMQANGNGNFFGDVTQTYGVFDFTEIATKAQEFFNNYGYLLTGGGRIYRPGERYIDFTLTEDYIDRIVIHGEGRNGYNGRCDCYTDSSGRRYCSGSDGTNGEDGADVVIYYPTNLSDRLNLLEIHNEGGLGGIGGHCSDGPDGRHGYVGRRGNIYYRPL